MIPRGNIHFAAAGLLEIGLQRAGVEVQQSFEIDPRCCATQRQNFNHQIVQCDLTQFLVSHEWDVDFILGTFPCNRYSTIGDIHGTRTGDDLFLHFFRRIAIKRPAMWGIENVPGMRKFPVVMEALTKLPGYYYQVFCPVQSELWLPQRRDRLFILATKKSFQWNAPKARRPVTLAQIVEKHPRIHLPDYVKRRIKGHYRDLPIISDPRRGDIAPTCVAHYGKDMGTRLLADKRFPFGVRPYTVREYARLQGIPDDFIFPVSDSEAYRQIGLGVSRQVGEWLGSEIKRYFRLN